MTFEKLGGCFFFLVNLLKHFHLYHHVSMFSSSQVTLTFGFQVELCRVDVELWPWGMDRGQACKKLEISTSSDPLSEPGQEQQAAQQKERGASKQQRPQEWEGKGHEWSQEAGDEPEPKVHTHTHTPDNDFKLVARCELKEETKVCFAHSRFHPRPPFLSSPPAQPSDCRQEALWSRGLLSLGAVTQLRVTVPFGGAGSALGLKSLSVWGQPARCCRAEDVQRIKETHEAHDRALTRPVVLASSCKPTQRQRMADPRYLDTMCGTVSLP